MLQIVLITIGVFAIALVGMAIGVIVSNRQIKGSCGGLNNFRDSAGNPICDACSDPSPTCSRIPEKEGCHEGEAAPLPQDSAEDQLVR